jgi:hypothetical protein
MIDFYFILFYCFYIYSHMYILFGSPPPSLFYSFLSEDAFWFLLNLWSDEAQLHSYPIEHINRSLISVYTELIGRWIKG